MTSKIAPRAQPDEFGLSFRRSLPMHSPQGPFAAVETDAALRHLWIQAFGAELFDAKHSRKIAADVLFTIKFDEESTGQFGRGEVHFKQA
jgi:hypothetical protein